MTAPFDSSLVEDYLRRLDLALANLPQTQAAELRDQIAAHLDDALSPDDDDHAIARVLNRLGSPEEIVAEAGYQVEVPTMASEAPAVASRRWWSRMPLGLAAAAFVLALVAVVGSFTWDRPSNFAAVSVGRQLGFSVVAPARGPRQFRIVIGPAPGLTIPPQSRIGFHVPNFVEFGIVGSPGSAMIRRGPGEVRVLLGAPLPGPLAVGNWFFPGWLLPEYWPLFQRVQVRPVQAPVRS